MHLYDAQNQYIIYNSDINTVIYYSFYNCCNEYEDTVYTVDTVDIVDTIDTVDIKSIEPTKNIETIVSSIQLGLSDKSDKSDKLEELQSYKLDVSEVSDVSDVSDVSKEQPKLELEEELKKLSNPLKKFTKIDMLNNKCAMHIFEMNIRDFNQYIKKYNITVEQTNSLRKLRRRMKNRHYARISRDRRK